MAASIRIRFAFQNSNILQTVNLESSVISVQVAPSVSKAYTKYESLRSLQPFELYMRRLCSIRELFVATGRWTNGCARGIVSSFSNLISTILVDEINKTDFFKVRSIYFYYFLERRHWQLYR